VEDFDIIKRVQGGEIEAFSLLVEKYHAHLLNFIYRIVRDERIVEDIGQEVFLNLYKSIGNFDVERGTPFSAWLFMSARNRCITELRKSRKRIYVAIEDAGALAVGEKSAESVLIEKENRELISASLEQLPKPYKDVILQSLRGDSAEEIAAGSRISIGTVKSRLFRAREKLRVILSERFGGKGYERI
jgi:RNA polymerase sigma-70 factor (ECF subfamily)